MPKTVLVLGAGASYEVGLPIGDTLKEQIAGSLGFKPNQPGQLRGDEAILGCFRILAKKAGTGELNRWYAACRQIVDGMPHAISIDNYLHQRGDADIDLCGKLAIV
jgi:hypothetical protein